MIEIAAQLQATVPQWEATLISNQMPTAIPEWVREFSLAIAREDGTPDWAKAREVLAQRTAEVAGIPFEYALEVWAGMGEGAGNV